MSGICDFIFSKCGIVAIVPCQRDRGRSPNKWMRKQRIWKQLLEIHQDDEDLVDRPEKEASGIGDSMAWEKVKEINGLWLCRNFLSIASQSDLLSAILNEGWFVEESINQAMRFGDLPSWAMKVSDLIRETVEFVDLPVLPADLLWREPLFDQLIVNIYQPGEGICAHVDLLRFEDGITIVSLESSCVMRFSPTEKHEDDHVDVLLSPGSLVLVSGDARYNWKHEINRKQSGFQVWEGKEIDHKRRISITSRAMSGLSCFSSLVRGHIFVNVTN